MEITHSALESFLSKNGRRFYRIPAKERTAGQKGRKIRLERRGGRIPDKIKSADGNVVLVPFMAGKDVFSTTWVEDEDE